MIKVLLLFAFAGCKLYNVNGRVMWPYKKAGKGSEHKKTTIWAKQENRKA